jgi:TolB-like protein/tetratricopeptide (TPR) repeat protein
MGAVYRALDPLLNRHVALKLLHPDPSHDVGTRAEWSARMLREARAAAAFAHPNVVAVYDVGVDDGAPFIAMELISGRTLRLCIGDSGIPLSQRVRWLVDVARALAAAHRAGIIHRDVKPENILVTDEGAVKILDFGVAKVSAGELGVTQPAQTLTAEGMILGTPQYMAPEQIRSEPLDGRVDQFAWGVVAFELLTGRSLWAHGTQPMRLIASILMSVAPPPRTVAPSIPAPVSAVVERALAKRAADRFADMDAVADALELALGATAKPRRTAHVLPATPTPGSDAKARRRRTSLQVAAVALVALLAGAALGVVVLVRHRTRTTAETRSTASSAGRRSIGVIAFENLTRHSEDDWLRIGLADALEARLASVQGIEIVPRASLGISQSGGKQTAEWLVSGSFQKIGDQIRIAARAARASEPSRIAASTEQRGTMAQIFDLQDSLALALAEKMQAGASPAVQKAIRESGTRNLEAFEAFTMGRTLLSVGRVPEAMRAFDHAVVADPEYRDARATLNRVRAESHHFLVQEDGTVVETISEVFKGDPGSAWELTTDSGTLTRAWDLEGNALRVDRVAASGNQATFHVIVGTREQESARGIVYELESSSKDKHLGGLSVLFHSVAKNSSGENIFIVQLPRGAQALSAIPTPEEVREDEGGTLLVLREARGAFVPMAWSVVHAAEKAVSERFRSEKPRERADWIASVDPRMARHGWSIDLARATDTWQVCSWAKSGQVDSARQLLAKMAAAVDPYGRFFMARGQFCVAAVSRDDRAAAAALEAAILADDRPAQLIPEAYLDAIDWCLERKRIDDLARLSRLEHRETPWWTDRLFHNRLTTGDPERMLRSILGRESGNVAASYDLALTLYEGKRYAEASEVLKNADEFLGGVYVADLRVRIAIARGQPDEAAAEVRKLVSYYPMTWAWIAHAVLLASAERADEAFAVVVEQAPKTEYEPPLFWALRYVVGVLPHASRYAERIADIVKKARETLYGQPYRLDRMIDLIEVASLSVDAEGPLLASLLFEKQKALLRDMSPEACNEACLRRLGSHLCRVRGLTLVQRSWVAATCGERCD